MNFLPKHNNNKVSNFGML
jgi:hypothetical protein